MATSGVLKGPVNQNLYLTFEWSRSAVDIAKNTSTITWSLKLNSDYSLNFSADKSYTLSVNGTDYSGTFSDNINWGDSFHSAVIKSGTSVITHDSDGSKTFNVSALLNIAVTISGVYVPTLSVSGNQILDTIPRATTPTLVPATGIKMGDTIKISLNRASDTFTHNITYKFGGSSGTIATDATTSTNWTIPRALANQIPSSLSGICVLTCKTYRGTTLIGTTSINVSIKVNDADYPSISAVTLSEATAGIAAKFKAYVQNQSKLNVSIVAAGANSSTIKKYEVAILGKQYDKSTFTSELLDSSGTVNVTVKVTDTRNRAVSTTKTINVLEYAPPKIALFGVMRADKAGGEDNTGAYLKASIGFTVNSLNDLNDKSYKLEYQVQGTTDWTQATSGSVYTLDTTYLSSSEVLNVDSPYSVRLTVSDYFSSVTRNVSIPTGFTLIDIHSNGNGLAFGKVAETENLIDVAIPTHFKKSLTYDIPIVTTGSINDIKTSGEYYLANDITDRPVNANGWLEVKNYLGNYIYQRYVTYSGRTYERIMSAGTWGDWCGLFNVGIWTYEKQLNGVIKCWGTLEQSNVNFDTKVADSWYRPSSTSAITYPEPFIELPKTYFSTSISNSSGSILTYTTGATVKGTSLWMQKLVSGTANIKLAIEVIGKWK